MKVTRKALAKDLAEIAAKVVAAKAAPRRTLKVAPPRLSPVHLEGLQDDEAPAFRSGERYDAMRYSRADADGLELSGIVFAECEFAGVSFNETQLRGASFRDCFVDEAYAPVLTAARSTLHDVAFRNPRWGSAEMYDSGWQSVRIDGGKLDFVNLRGSRLADILITDCIINELDLGSVTGARIALNWTLAAPR
jgi:uncharacterized protein YjbI with pentapeptide repeats